MDLGFCFSALALRTIRSAGDLVEGLSLPSDRHESPSLSSGVADIVLRLKLLKRFFHMMIIELFLLLDMSLGNGFHLGLREASQC